METQRSQEKLSSLKNLLSASKGLFINGFEEEFAFFGVMDWPVESDISLWERKLRFCGKFWIVFFCFLSLAWLTVNGTYWDSVRKLPRCQSSFTREKSGLCGESRKESWGIWGKYLASLWIITNREIIRRKKLRSLDVSRWQEGKMGNVESVDGQSEMKHHIMPLKVPMPDPTELEEKFAIVLVSQNEPRLFIVLYLTVLPSYYFWLHLLSHSSLAVWVVHPLEVNYCGFLNELKVCLCLRINVFMAHH